jgi:hypothetical protein
MIGPPFKWKSACQNRLANLFSREYPWIQPRLFQFARRLRKVTIVCPRMVSSR